MSNLGVFYIFVDRFGQVKVEFCSDVFSMRRRWLKDRGFLSEGVLIHIGHHAPLIEGSFAAILSEHPGQVLGTESCKWALPEEFACASEPTARLRLVPSNLELNLYRFTGGFDHVDEVMGSGFRPGATVPPASMGEDFTPSVECEGWIGHFLEDYPEFKAEFAVNNIHSMATFDVNKGGLSHATQLKACNYKEGFDRITRGNEVRARVLLAHPKFRKVSLEGRLRSVRLQNVFGKAGICSVGDLLKYTDDKLLVLRNFGRTTLSDLHGSLDQIFRSGQQLADPSIYKSEPEDDLSYQVNSDWILAYLNKHEERRQIFDQHQVVDDLSYRSGRQYLDSAIRDEADIARFNHLIRKIDLCDPISIASICPIVVQEREIESLAVSGRVRNVMQQMRVTTVGDLVDLPRSTLKNQRNFAADSLRNLSEGLIQAVDQIADRRLKIDQGNRSNLLDEIRSSINVLDNKQRHVISSRLGIGVSYALTLEEIAKQYSVSRERIRQIEKKIIETWKRTDSWCHIFQEKISKLLESRTTPLWLGKISEEDAWFAGCDKELNALEFLIDKFFESKLYVLDVLGEQVVTHLSKDKWLELIQSTNEWIRHSVLGREMSRSSINDHINQFCSASNNPDLGPCLMDVCLENAHFAKDSAGVDRLISMGRSVEHFIRVVLEESKVPLHFKEIHKRCQQQAQRNLDVRRVTNGCGSAEGVYLLGRGKYGLRRHIPVSDDVAAQVREICEQLVATGDANRQWHTDELADEVEDRIGPLNFDRYSLNVILSESEQLLYLKRMVWCQKADESIEQEDRAQIYELALKTLQVVGRPMSARDLSEEIRKIRGIKPRHQFHQTERMIRVEPNVWGLAERDIPASADVRKILQDRVYNCLAALGRSLHISEFGDYEDEIQRPAGITDYLVYTICKMDLRFHGWVGGLLGLEEWGEPRGVSFQQAGRSVIESLTTPKTLQEIHSMIEEVAGRKIDRQRISALLSQSLCEWDPVTCTWSLPTDAEVLESAVDMQSTGSI